MFDRMINKDSVIENLEFNEICELFEGSIYNYCKTTLTYREAKEIMQLLDIKRILDEVLSKDMITIAKLLIINGDKNK